jgi:flavodoxin
MKVLVVYYSYDGNTRFIAETVANELDADICGLHPVKEMKSKGFFKYVWGGAMVAMKQKPALLPFDKNPADYDLVIIGTPVWNSSMTPPVRSFLDKYGSGIKSAALFCCYSGGMKNTFAEMRGMLGGGGVTGEMGFLDPLGQNESESARLAREWAKPLIINGGTR